MNTDYSKIKVLFVCTGNICRSPLAEGLFNAYLQQHNLSERFIVDSAGTSSYHIDDLADRRAREVAKQNGTLLTHRARQFLPPDFDKFDYILVMDHLNYDAIASQTNNQQHLDKVLLFRSFDNENPDVYEVPDPYYGGLSDFVEVGEILNRSIEGFITFLRENRYL